MVEQSIFWKFSHQPMRERPTRLKSENHAALQIEAEDGSKEVDVTTDDRLCHGSAVRTRREQTHARTPGRKLIERPHNRGAFRNPFAWIILTNRMATPATTELG